MALWMVRAGKHGEYENKFLGDGRIYLTWDGLSHDLSQVQDKSQLQAVLKEYYPDAGEGRIVNNSGQIWAFSKRIQPGDWVALPSKHKPAIHIGEVKSDYTFVPNADDPYYHYRDVEWFAVDIPRSNFDQDILYSLGAFMSVCQISRNDAEKRVRAMAENGWKSQHVTLEPIGDDADESEQSFIDLPTIARDQIAKHIIYKFQGHGLARLVDAVLRAQGYETHLSPEGPDKGIDILAAPAPMGFGEPRICVQVKSGDSPLDRPTLDQLIGVMQNVNATNGLLVSWGGFKGTVDREVATQFFRVRLWDQDDLVDQVLSNVENLDQDIRAELPLKRIWVIKGEEE